MECGNNLKQIGVALHNYHAAFSWFPYGGSYDSDVTPGSSGAGAFNWRSFILPFLEQASLYDDIKDGIAPDFVELSDQACPSSAWVKVFRELTAQKVIISTYQCPSDSVANRLRAHSSPHWPYLGTGYSASPTFRAATSNYWGSGGPASLGSEPPRGCGYWP